MKIVTSHWLDYIHLWIFFAMFPLLLIVIAVIHPLRRNWLIESRQWSSDRGLQYLDESSHNKTGENFRRWLIRNGHRQARTLLNVMWLLTAFTLIWPFISKDYCSINTCRGQLSPAGSVSR